MNRIALTLVAGALCAALSGCGASDSPTKTQTPAQTQAQPADSSMRKEATFDANMKLMPVPRSTGGTVNTPAPKP